MMVMIRFGRIVGIATRPFTAIKSVFRSRSSQEDTSSHDDEEGSEDDNTIQVDEGEGVPPLSRTTYPSSLYPLFYPG